MTWWNSSPHQSNQNHDAKISKAVLGKFKIYKKGGLLKVYTHLRPDFLSWQKTLADNFCHRNSFTARSMAVGNFCSGRKSTLMLTSALICMQIRNQQNWVFLSDPKNTFATEKIQKILHEK